MVVNFWINCPLHIGIILRVYVSSHDADNSKFCPLIKTCLTKCQEWLNAFALVTLGLWEEKVGLHHVVVI